MTNIEKVKQEITEIQKINMEAEQELNTLYEERRSYQDRLLQTESKINITERKISELKRNCFDKSRTLDVLVKDKAAKERDAKIRAAIQNEPTFDDMLQKELNTWFQEVQELWHNREIDVDPAIIFARYENKIRDAEIPSRETAIHHEAETRYKQIITDIVSRELDGNKIDYLERRSLKLPVRWFLDNQHIKQTLEI